MKDSLVAINILVNDNTILNKNGVPLLFYWDGNSDTLINDIYNNHYLKGGVYYICQTQKIMMIFS